MDKKFMKISLIIIIPIILTIGFFKINIRDINNTDEDYIHPADELVVKALENKQDKESYIITVAFENNTKNILSLYDTELRIDYKSDINGSDYGQNDIYIKGQDLKSFDENYKMGIDPGETSEIVFKIPKGITFDKEKFNLETAEVSYNAGMYKIRTSERSLALGIGSMGASKSVDLNID